LALILADDDYKGSLLRLKNSAGTSMSSVAAWQPGSLDLSV
jgi:hypothetical protein